MAPAKHGLPAHRRDMAVVKGIVVPFEQLSNPNEIDLNILCPAKLALCRCYVGEKLVSSLGTELSLNGLDGLAKRTKHSLGPSKRDWLRNILAKNPLGAP